MISTRNVVRLLLGGGLGVLAVGHVACSTTPPEENIPTLQRAERLATLCLKVNRPADNPAGYEPLPEAEPAPEQFCNGASPELEFVSDGERYPYHYFALATGTLAGELAAIDMTIYQAADTDKSTPGVNFVPVGERPTDVAATPDSRWAFVASAAAQKPALYAVPSNFIVGDGRGVGSVPKLTDLVACSLPQAAGGLAIVPNGSSAKSPYDVVVVLPGDRITPARLAVIDVASFADPRSDGAPTNGDAGTAAEPAVVLTPGTFDACPIKYLVDATLPPPPPATADVPWGDGVAYLENGARTADSYPLPTSCGAESPTGDAGIESDAGAAGSDVDAGPRLLPPRLPRFGSSTQDGTTLYVADLDNPIIHVFDLSAGAPVELAPLEVISSADLTGTLSVRDIAVSPPTRTFKRYLYAVEAAQGSLLVYDVTDKASTYRKPLVRPHAELQPFQPADRIAFASAVNAITFARHDVAVARGQSYVSGVLCNPNYNAGNGPDNPGLLYTASSTSVEPELGPKRLRGVFGFAALANGQIVVLDVDDWDAPCRRPANLGDSPRASAISEPQTEAPFDPYGVPGLTTPERAGLVSREAFFPVSAPHRLRSSFMLRNENDSEGGDRIPTYPGAITLSQGNTPLDVAGSGSEANPLLQPTFATFADPGNTAARQTAGVDGGTALTPGVRFSYEVPDVHLDQDWAISYEGALPGFPGVRGTLSSTNDHQTLTLSSPETNFCLLGVEDAPLAGQHAKAFNAAAGADLDDELLESRVGDYVQITDELLPDLDPYWLLNENDCWSEVDATLAANLSPPERGAAHRDVCQRTFGNASDTLTSRDFPILEASEGRLVLGRYKYPPEKLNSVSERVVVPADGSNRALLKAAQCCFHNQVQFNVRAGGTWLAFGSVNGYLHHVEADETGRCVQSCENRERLMNSRAFSLPREALDREAPPRSSVLAMRNPMFSYFLVDGRDLNGRVRPERDVVWRFQSRNQFAALSLSLTDTQVTANPKAMRYLPPLGQVVVLDGASQGLTLIDLRTMGFAAKPVY